MHFDVHVHVHDCTCMCMWYHSVMLCLSPSLSSSPSPMLDSVHQKHINSDQLAEDFQVAFRGCELADVAFIVGDSHMPLYAVKAILACRSRSVQPPTVGGPPIGIP